VLRTRCARLAVEKETAQGPLGIAAVGTVWRGLSWLAWMQLPRHAPGDA